MRQIRQTIARAMMIIMMIFSISPYYDTAFAESNTGKALRAESIRVAQYQSEVKENLQQSKCELIVKTKVGKSEEFAKALKENASLKMATIASYDDFQVVQLATEAALEPAMEIINQMPTVEWAQRNLPLNAYSATEATNPSTEAAAAAISAVINSQSAQVVNTEVTDETALRGVLVGVLDSGIDLEHPALKGQMYINVNEIPGNQLDDDGNGFIDDVNGWDFLNQDNTVFDAGADESHGTKIAGIIAGKDSSKEYRGLAPNATILPLKFMNGKLGYTSDAIAAIDYAKKMGVKIINGSFGGSENNIALKKAIEASGILFVAAAGNDGKSLDKSPVYPAAYALENVLTIGAMNDLGGLWSQSNYGKAVDAIAPGSSILCPTVNGDYGRDSGTSFAAAFATGLAAKLLGEKPELTAKELRVALLKTARQDDGLKASVSGGRVLKASLSQTTILASTDVARTETLETTAPVVGNSKVAAFGVNLNNNILEAIHFGEAGVNAATGNYSTSGTDYSLDSPGFDVTFTRTYNSKDERTIQTLGKGWTFGFEGSLKDDPATPEIVTIKLPSGKVSVFKKNGSQFEPYDSRGSLVKKEGDPAVGYVLTTEDQYRYEFKAAQNSNKEYVLASMIDRNGNRLSIETDAYGRVLSVTDGADRKYTIGYTQEKISSITLPNGKSIQYTYFNGLLNKVTTPGGKVTEYLYDGTERLINVKDSYGNVLETVTYENNALGLVSTYVDSNNKAQVFTHYPKESRVVYTDGASLIEKFYDENKYTTKTNVLDPANRQVLFTAQTTYFLDAEGKNRFGDVKTATDFYDNTTSYERDTKGNVTKVINPDKSFRTYIYDDKNNLITEINESGKKKYSIYDEDGLRLQKEVVPFDGVSPYTDDSDRSKFQIIEYRYFSDLEENRLNIKIKGLIKEKIDPNGNVFRYAYDKYGNKSEITDPEGYTTKYEYNEMGWLLNQENPDGLKINYAYNNDSYLVRRTENTGSESRSTKCDFDLEGRKIAEIDANHYQIGKDESLLNKGSFNYQYDGSETKYTYYPSGKLKSTKLPNGSLYQYEYDVNGYQTYEVLPNSTAQRTEYDELKRPIRKSFYKNTGDRSDSQKIVLEEITYIKPDAASIKKCISEKRVKTYLSLNDYKNTEGLTENFPRIVETSVFTDYTGREVRVKRQDGTESTTQYNKDGNISYETDFIGNTKSYIYDGANRVAEVWLPMEDGLYSYSQFKYDPNGNTVEEARSVDLVRLHYKSDNDKKRVVKFKYNRINKQIRKELIGGAVTESHYDEMGRVVGEYVTADDKTVRKTTYEYNAFGQLTEKAKYALSAELDSRIKTNKGEVKLAETYDSDRNGNVLKVTQPDGEQISTEYDALNRPVKVTKNITVQSGKNTFYVTNRYDIMGNLVQKIDFNGNVTDYKYDERNQKVAEINYLSKSSSDTAKIPVIQLFKYNQAGQVIAAVSPKNAVGINLENVSTIDFSVLNRSEYRYDQNGNRCLVREVYKDATDGKMKEVVTYAANFDANGNVIKEISGEAYKNASGDTFESKRKSAVGKYYTYNRASKVKTVNTAEGAKAGKQFVLKYNYDGLTRKKDDINVFGQVNSYYYDTDSNLTSVGKRRSVHEPETVIEKRVYNKAGDLIECYDALGNKIAFSYSQSGLLNAATTPFKADKDKYVTKFNYDLNGLQTQMTDSMGKIVQTKYNELGLATEIVNKSANGADQIVQRFTFDALGKKTSETDGKGNLKQIEYDSLGRVIALKAPSPTEPEKQLTLVAYEYDLNGNQIAAYDKFGNKTVSNYDQFNRLIERVDAKGKTIERLVYDNDHKQIRSIDALGNGIAYKYDLDGALLGESKRIPQDKLSDPESLKWNSQKYDLSGKLIEKTDRLGHKTKFSYDALERLNCVENVLGEKTTYSYDLNGNLISQTDGNGNTTLIEYNEKNQMIRRVDPEGRSEKDGEYVYNEALTVSMNYNPDGTLKSTTDRNGNNFSYQYDPLGRHKKTVCGKEFITSAYDPNGNLIKSANNSTEIIRQYDSFNRTSQKSIKGMGTSSFDYGDQGEKKTDGSGWYHKETTVDVKGNTLTQTFDENGRLQAIEDGQDKTEYQYNDNGSKAKTLYPVGINSSYNYNPDNTVKGLVNQSQSGTIDNYSYEYDDCGNMVKKTDSSGTTVYTYDSLNRIKMVVEPSKKTTEYEYDAAGNRIRERVIEKENVVTKDYKYNTQNRLIEISEHDLVGKVDKAQKFVYDNNGNQLYFKLELTQRATEDAQASFGMFISGESYSGESAKQFFESNSVNTYNCFNQLVKTTVGDTEVRHKYDPDGLRIEKVVVKAGKSKVTKYLRLGSEIAMELDEKGDVISRNVNGTAPISREMNGTKYFLLYNGEGDVTALVDRSGKVAERYEYDAFGNVTKTVDGNGKSFGIGESKNPVRYKGYEYDEETKLYYLNARMYDPSTARFIQEDTYRGEPKDPLSLNLYTYCHNNPLIYSDPTGHKHKATVDRDTGGNNPPLVKPDKKNISSNNNKKKEDAIKKEQEQKNKVATNKLASLKDNVVEQMTPKKIIDTLTDLGTVYANVTDAKLKQEISKKADVLRKELSDDHASNELFDFYEKHSHDGSKIELNGKLLPVNTETLKMIYSDQRLWGKYELIQGKDLSDYKANLKKSTTQVISTPNTDTRPDKMTDVQVNSSLPEGTPPVGKIAYKSLMNGTKSGFILDSPSYSNSDVPIGLGVLAGTLAISEGYKALSTAVGGKTADTVQKEAQIVEDGVLENANFAQKTFSNTFSPEGIKKYSELAGQPIKTIDDLTVAIKTGKVNPTDLTVEYIVRDGNTLILNTRTSQALTQAGIPRSQWSTLNQTGNEFFEGLLTGQLLRNGLTSAGTPTVRLSGGIK